MLNLQSHDTNFKVCSFASVTVSGRLDKVVKIGYYSAVDSQGVRLYCGRLKEMRMSLKAARGGPDICLNTRARVLTSAWQPEDDDQFSCPSWQLATYWQLWNQTRQICAIILVRITGKTVPLQGFFFYLKPIHNLPGTNPKPIRKPPGN